MRCLIEGTTYAAGHRRDVLELLRASARRHAIAANLGLQMVRRLDEMRFDGMQFAAPTA